MAISNKRIISSMLWKLLERFSTQLVSFVISIIIARLLLPSDFGIIAIILVFINLANVIIDGGLNTALIQKKGADQQDFSTIFWFCLILSIILYLLLFCLSPVIANFYNNDILIRVLRVLGISIFFNSFNSIQIAYVSRHMLFQKLFYANAISLLFSGIIGIYMAYNNFGVWALVAQYSCTPIIRSIIMWFSIDWHPNFYFSRNRFQQLFDYGWKIFLTNFIIAIYEDIRSLIIGKLYEPSSLAFFDRGKSFPTLLMSNISNAINSVLLPTFSDIQDDASRVKQMMRRSNQGSYLFIAPLLVGLFVIAEELIIVLLTNTWLAAVAFVQIFCIAYILMPIQNNNMTAIKSLGYSDITLKLELIKKILEAIILVVSFTINVYAVAWGIVVYNFVSLFINLYPSKKLIRYGIIEQLKDVVPILFISGLMGGSMYFIKYIPYSPLTILILKILVGTIVYTLLCRIFKIEIFDYFKCLIRQHFVSLIQKSV